MCVVKSIKKDNNMEAVKFISGNYEVKGVIYNGTKYVALADVSRIIYGAVTAWIYKNRENELKVDANKLFGLPKNCKSMKFVDKNNVKQIIEKRQTPIDNKIVVFLLNEIFESNEEKPEEQIKVPKKENKALETKEYAKAPEETIEKVKNDYAEVAIILDTIERAFKYAKMKHQELDNELQKVYDIINEENESKDNKIKDLESQVKCLKTIKRGISELMK